MSDTTPQSVSNGCRKYAKSRIDFNNFNTFINVIESYLRGFPDDALPHVAHRFVDTAIANNGLSLFDGNVVFDKDDLVELKHYLEWNLPVGASPEYEVKTSGDNTNTNTTQ